MIDYVFRYDPEATQSKAPPADAEEARRALMEGNRVFAQWMATCRHGEGQAECDSQYVVPSGGLMIPPRGQAPGGPTLQKPFAVVLGCSDARVPTEMLFGQGFNHLFVVRVAGNILGDQTQGTMDFATAALKESVRLVVVLGHTHCGAIKGAVDAYLNPGRFWSKDYSPALRTIFQKIFVAVRESDNALRSVWGPDAPTRSGYREALTDMAACLNAAHTAYGVRQTLAESGSSGIGVVFGVYDIQTHRVTVPDSRGDDDDVELDEAPADPREMAELALRMAECRLTRDPHAGSVSNGHDRGPQQVTPSR